MPVGETFQQFGAFRPLRKRGQKRHRRNCQQSPQPHALREMKRTKIHGVPA